MNDPLHPSDADLAVQVETGTGPLGLGLGQRMAAEALGTGFLVLAVVGSGIMAQRLSPDQLGLQLLENASATAAALVGLILAFGAVSGAHFNPVVTLVDRFLGTTTTTDTGAYMVAQVAGGCAGAWIGGAYWFTSSTSFANPAVTVARMLSDTFAGIAPRSAPMFIVMQLAGAVLAFGLVRLFYPHDHTRDPHSRPTH